MSNKFDTYDDNDEITLSSSSNDKVELKKENLRLNQLLDKALLQVKEYEQVINNGNIKDIKGSNLSEDDIFNITQNSTFILAND
jgi:hypothetical protein